MLWDGNGAATVLVMNADRDRPPALEHVAPAGGGRLPLVLVIVSLALLVAFPLAMQGRLDHLQTEIEGTVEPARDLLTELQFAMSLETASTRAYLLTGEPEYTTLYRQTRAQRDAVLEEVLPLVGRLGPGLQAGAAAIADELEDADRLLASVMSGAISPQAYHEALRTQDLQLRDLLERVNELDVELAEEV